ncbi:MAG: FAD-dependent oxidoreductase [Euryarchaeota archaeon]|nr:FAD-dependent oxidoreductase [Euryarchaeota archaeon]
MNTDILVIGGSAAGIVAAATAKKHYPGKKIILVRKEEKVLIPCGIPYTMSMLNGLEYNLIPDAAVTGKGIGLIIDEVVGIDRTSKCVDLGSGDQLGYEKLVLATGSNPLVTPITGVSLNGVFTIIKDFDTISAIKGRLEQSQNLVIVGGGFIGIEFADECRKRGDIRVSIVEMLDHVLALACDEEIYDMVELKLKDKGVDLFTSSKVVEIIGMQKVEAVRLDNGRVLDADMVILAGGVIPNVDLARDAGIDHDERNGVKVDEFMRTSDPDIFACGDCVEKPSFFGQAFEAARLASIATNEGRVVGANLYELRRTKQGSINIFSTVVDDLVLGMAGLTSEQAKAAGIAVVIGRAEGMDRHPGKMPGASNMLVSLVFRKYDGMLIGAQIYGGVSVGELINVLGLAMQNRMTAENLAIMQVGTHPALTASPVVYQLTNAAEDAISKLH